MHKPSLTYTAG